MVDKLKSEYKSGYFVGDIFFGDDHRKAEEFIQHKEVEEYLCENGFLDSASEKAASIIIKRYILTQRRDYIDSAQQDDDTDKVA